MMCQMQGMLSIEQTGLQRAAAQWNGMLFAAVAQGLGGSTILWVSWGCIQVGLQIDLQGATQTHLECLDKLPESELVKGIQGTFGTGA